MTPFPADPLVRFVSENDYAAISKQVGVIAVVLLIALLIERELFRTSDRDIAIRWMNIFILPLLLAFGMIVGLRFLELVR